MEKFQVCKIGYLMKLLKVEMNNFKTKTWL